jgi:hypothetical protein
LAQSFLPTLRLITVAITGIIITARFSGYFFVNKTRATVPGLSFAWKDLPAITFSSAVADRIY